MRNMIRTVIPDNTTAMDDIHGKQRRFLVFTYNNYYPNGGMRDLMGSFDTEDEAVQELKSSLLQGYDTSGSEGHVFDTEAGITSNFKVQLVSDDPTLSVYLALDALAYKFGYLMPDWTAAEIAADLVIKSEALDGRDPKDLEPAVESWLQNRRKG